MISVYLKLSFVYLVKMYNLGLNKKTIVCVLYYL